MTDVVVDRPTRAGQCASQVVSTASNAVGWRSCGRDFGLLVGGVLGRLAMRLLAVTSGQSAQGGVTDDQAIVGEATLRGTVTLALINCSAAPSAAHCSSMSTDHSTTQCSPQPG
jgi:hypothetical protein